MSGQTGRGGSNTGGARGGVTGTGGGVGKGGVSGSDGGISSGGAAELPVGGPETGVDGPVRWRNSGNSLCVPTSVGLGSASVYSDDRNLFVMAWSTPDSKPAPDSPASIWANDGAGWRTYFSWSKDAQFPSRFYGGTRAGLRGRADGSLFAFGRFGCAIELIDDAGEHCSGAVPSVADLFAMGTSTPYATDGYYLLKYDGSIWTQVGERFPASDAGMRPGYALWADASTVVVGGSNGYIITVQDEKVVTMLPTPGKADNITGVWSFGANDLWAATEGGDLYGYDGAQWTLKWKSAVGGAARLWGMAGHLFVVGYGQFAEWDGSTLRSLLPSEQADRQFTDVWGNSPTEVFATSVATSGAQIGSCNAVELWWYDGTTARTM
jgi:hypothetical protein